MIAGICPAHSLQAQGKRFCSGPRTSVGEGEPPLLIIWSQPTELIKANNLLGGRQCFSLQTFLTQQNFTKVVLSSSLRHYPGPLTPGRIMTDMLPMPAFQIRHPIVIFILMKPNNFLFQEFPLFFDVLCAAEPQSRIDLFGEGGLSAASF